MTTYRWPCPAPGCKKKRQYPGHKYCHMHMARLKRNGTLLTQKEMGIVYNTKLGKLIDTQLEYIKNHHTELIDKEIASELNVPLHLVRYARRKICGRKYKGLDGKTYLLQKYREMKGNTCEICGWNEGPCDLHHKLPRARGGKHEIKNLICVCPNHHRLIHTKGIRYVLKQLS